VNIKTSRRTVDVQEVEGGRSSLYQNSSGKIEKLKLLKQFGGGLNFTLAFIGGGRGGSWNLTPRKMRDECKGFSRMSDQTYNRSSNLTQLSAVAFSGKHQNYRSSARRQLLSQSVGTCVRNYTASRPTLQCSLKPPDSDRFA
jgi:hypothetical protein